MSKKFRLHFIENKIRAVRQSVSLSVIDPWDMLNSEQCSKHIVLGEIANDFLQHPPPHAKIKRSIASPPMVYGAVEVSSCNE